MLEFLQSQPVINFIGGIIIFLFLVWQVIEKAFGNIGWFKKRKDEREKARLLKQEKEITSLVSKNIIPPILEEIETINGEQNKKLDCLVNSTNDTMRLELLRVYFHYRPYKKIPQWAKEAAVKLHDDYVAQDGNTFVADLWAQLSQWEVVPSEEDIFGYKGREEI